MLSSYVVIPEDFEAPFFEDLRRGRGTAVEEALAEVEASAEVEGLPRYLPRYSPCCSARVATDLDWRCSSSRWTEPLW